MKIKKLFFVLAAVALVAAVFVVPAFAQEPIPPTPIVEPPAFDWTAISEALNTLISALLVPVFAFAARWLLAQGNITREKLSAEQSWALEMAIKTFVYAAEQMHLKGYIDDKLAYVTERTEEWLAERNIAMKLNEIRARIESAVRQEFNTKKIAGAG